MCHSVTKVSLFMAVVTKTIDPQQRVNVEESTEKNNG